MPGKKQSLFVRWAEKIRYDDPTGCWLWTGALRGTRACRYGKIRAGARAFGFLNAHYVGFEHFKRRVRAGYELDHTCNTSICVNPWHLEEVKRRTNERR